MSAEPSLNAEFCDDAEFRDDPELAEEPEPSPISLLVWILILLVEIAALIGSAVLTFSGGTVMVMANLAEPYMTPARFIYIGLVVAIAAPFMLLARFPRTPHWVLDLLVALSVATIIITVLPALPFANLFLFAVLQPIVLLIAVPWAFYLLLPPVVALVLARHAMRGTEAGSRPSLIVLPAFFMLVAVAMVPIASSSHRLLTLEGWGLG